MGDSQQNDLPPRELRNLVERIKRGNCVLVLGPCVAVRANDPSRRPLDELLASELLKDLGPLENEASRSPLTLRRAADLYLDKKIGDRVSLELDVKDFYTREAGTTTDFHPRQSNAHSRRRRRPPSRPRARTSRAPVRLRWRSW